jgi:pimeloyl-ACP methyl ester carboxylesterase
MPTWSGVTPPTPWHGAGTRVGTVDGQVFVRTEGALEGGTALVLLHGFPSSSWEFASAMHRLASAPSLSLPVVAIDFLGAGLSDKPPTFRYGVYEQTDVVLTVLRHLGLTAVHLVAHDSAVAVAAEILARYERSLLSLTPRSVVFVAGSPLRTARASALAEWMAPVAERRATFGKVTSFSSFRREMRRLMAYPETVADQELRVAYELLTREHGLLRWDALAAMGGDREGNDDRWAKAVARTEVPVLALFGDRDPRASVATGERLIQATKHGRLRVLRDVGHYPQLETPDAFAAEIVSFVASVGE